MALLGHYFAKCPNYLHFQNVHPPKVAVLKAAFSVKHLAFNMLQCGNTRFRSDLSIRKLRWKHNQQNSSYALE